LEVFPHFLDCQADLRDVQQLRKHIEGLFAETRVNGRRGTRFQISNVVAQNARETTFTFEDREISVEHYYRRKYNIRLECPEAPLLTSQRGSQTDYFPMEISYILGGQRVQQSQQTSQQLRGMREV
uniref:PAZ domain-containing protein n=1 Tax=Gongylonema pulchrum TaxID=637853 RepID=A0A183EN86_9BILA